MLLIKVYMISYLQVHLPKKWSLNLSLKILMLRWRSEFHTQVLSLELLCWTDRLLIWTSGMSLLEDMEQLNRQLVERIDTLESKISLNSTLLRAAYSKSSPEMQFKQWSEWNGQWMNSLTMVVQHHLLTKLLAHSEFMPPQSKSLVFIQALLLSITRLSLTRA